MEFFKTVPKFDFMGKARFFGTMSLIAVVLSLVAIFIFGPRYGIDFAGGTELQVGFPTSVDSAQVRSALAKLGFPNAEVVTVGAGSKEFLVRLQTISAIAPEQANAARDSLAKALAANGVKRFELSPGGDKLTLRLGREAAIADVEKAIDASGLKVGTPINLAALKELKKAGDEEGQDTTKNCESATCTFGQHSYFVYETNLKGVGDQVMEGLRQLDFGRGAEKLRAEWVGPKVGKQLRIAGVSSLVYALLFIMLYVAIRFDLRFAPGGVVALLHDAIITVGFFAFARLEVTLTTVAAVLAIVGYSINDTIVVFDRIRENLAKVRTQDIYQVVNTSINETLSRTILTSGTTLLTVVAMLAIGWNTSIRDFAIALLVGISIGTYSSIFIASPLVVWLDRRFGRKQA